MSIGKAYARYFFFRTAQHAHFLREYGDQDSKANERGYHRTSEDQGDDGYKHFDSFHKKNSDKYGHEHHSAFGKSKKSKNRVSASNAKYDGEDIRMDK